MPGDKALDHGALPRRSPGRWAQPRSVQNSGKIVLNYVSPHARFRGVSKAIMARMEARASQLGLEACTLESTGTAHQFYLSIGYSNAGPPAPGFGITLRYPMAKRLAPRR